MTIDAAEIARLRTDAELERYANSDVILRLLDELEKARADTNQLAKNNLLLLDQSDAAHALLREALPLLWMGDAAIDLRARIAAAIRKGE